MYHGDDGVVGYLRLPVFFAWDKLPVDGDVDEWEPVLEAFEELGDRLALDVVVPGLVDGYPRGSLPLYHFSQYFLSAAGGFSPFAYLPPQTLRPFASSSSIFLWSILSILSSVQPRLLIF